MSHAYTTDVLLVDAAIVSSLYVNEDRSVEAL